MLKEHRIIGPPGTGKTTTLAHWVGEAARKFGSDRVLVSSFTRAAATEIAGRGIPVDKVNVGTLHAIAFRALDKPEIAEAHIGDWNAHRPDLALSRTVRAAPEDAAADEAWGTDALCDGDRLFTAYQTLRSRMVECEKWPEDVLAFHSTWMHWKIECGYLDFTDLIETALSEFDEAPNSPIVGFVDEAQDLDPLQFALVRKWAANMEYLVCVGDGDQSIYGFKGTSPRDFLGTEIPADRYKVLDASHRLPRKVRDLALSWIQRCAWRYPVTFSPRTDSGSIEVLETPLSVGDVVVEQVEQELDAGRSVMILAACSYMLTPTIAALRRRGIPFANPYRKNNGQWNPMRGGVERIRALLSVVPDDSAEEIGAWTAKSARQWIELLESRSCMIRGGKAAFDRLVREVESDEQTPLMFGTSRVLTLGDLSKIIEPEHLDQLTRSLIARDRMATLAWIDARCLASKRSLIDYALSVARRRGAQALSERPHVCVGTIHSVKGGEADTVILAPDLSASGFREWNEQGDRRDGVLRLFYVGMTRARSKLVITRKATWKAADLDEHARSVE